jgi:hypothetical protein
MDAEEPDTDEELEELLYGPDIGEETEGELFGNPDRALHEKARVTRMQNLNGVRAEMCKVYRYVRRGQLSAQTGVRMITMLKAIGDLRKAIDIERKLIDIQKMLAVHMKRSGRNGHA